MKLNQNGAKLNYVQARLVHRNAHSKLPTKNLRDPTKILKKNNTNYFYNIQFKNQNFKIIPNMYPFY